MFFVAAGTTSGKTLPWLLQATEENPWIGFWAFILTVALTMLVFHLGFARKLPLLKRLIVYTMLVLGSFFLWFLEFIFGAPIIAVLAISAVVLGIYRFRLHLHRKGDEKAQR
ncbi:YlaH-like family protein [Shouchella lonarensis]|uniref:YlaH-like protein n=1 Tax=Shouchella lonarensis TaxID=1464122 RepID=A0A1G6KRN7_9BACI|nr:YlaH-like family protein [Shouchella lonarensis]SDC33720.1 YlaH-like protein [Shouchella lonarensis]